LLLLYRVKYEKATTILCFGYNCRDNTTAASGYGGKISEEICRKEWKVEILLARILKDFPTRLKEM
jgi:hypothetical protein